MGRKAVSQVDFAIASGLFIMIFAFLVLFTTDYFSTMKNDATINERKGYALGLLNDMMSSGDPSDWEKTITLFSNNTAANWSRSIDSETNSTITLFDSGQLSAAGDSSAAYVDNTAGSDALEMTFPYLGIPASAVVGSASFKVLYNTTGFTRTYGEGDHDDDLIYFTGGDELYLDDWGNGSTVNQWVWWNSSSYVARLSDVGNSNNLIARLYYDPYSPNICYFDQVNFTVNYSYYPYYPRKIGIFADSYYAEILLNNTITNLASENVTINMTALGYPDADMNSVSVYDENGSPMPCNVSGKIILFQAAVDNGESKWFKIWFSRNSTSNFTSAFCNAAITGGTNNLTIANRNETVFGASRVSVAQYAKISALNSSIYGIMKSVSDAQYEFHITLESSSGSALLDYGEELPKKGDINALQRSVIYQNSSAGIEYGTLYVYMW